MRAFEFEFVPRVSFDELTPEPFIGPWTPETPAPSCMDQQDTTTWD